MKKILVPVDGSPHAGEALNIACDLASVHDGSILLVNVVMRDREVAEVASLPQSKLLNEDLRRALATAMEQPLSPFDPALAMAHPEAPERPVPKEALVALGEVILRQAQEAVAAKGLSATPLALADGNPAAAILQAAQAHDCDVIVMGCRGLGKLEATTFGSVSQDVTRAAPMRVIAVHDRRGA